MNQYIAHIDDITPRYFIVTITKLFCKQICSLAYNHYIIDHSMKTHSVCCHLLIGFVFEEIQYIIDTLVNVM